MIWLFCWKYTFYIISWPIFKKIVKSRQWLGYSAEIRVLYCKLGQFQKIREINAGHLYQGLDQSTKGFFMFELIATTGPSTAEQWVNSAPINFIADIVKKNPSNFWNYLVTSKQSGRFFSNFCFSEYRVFPGFDQAELRRPIGP